MKTDMATKLILCFRDLTFYSQVGTFRDRHFLSFNRTFYHIEANCYFIHICFKMNKKKYKGLDMHFKLFMCQFGT